MKDIVIETMSEELNVTAQEVIYTVDLSKYLDSSEKDIAYVLNTSEIKQRWSKNVTNNVRQCIIKIFLIHSQFIDN